MIRSQRFNLRSPKSDRALSQVTEEINEFFKNRPACKIINIEHVFSHADNSFGSEFAYICVWYSDD